MSCCSKQGAGITTHGSTSIHIPAGFAKIFANPRVNWLSQSEPAPNLNDRIMYQPRGKVLGGTSSINGMVYMRGNRADYDEWVQRGCEGWGFDSVLPYFRRAEDNELGEDDFHRIGGPLHVSDPPRWELGHLLLKACVQAGIPHNPDFNGAGQDGAGYYQTTINAGRRWSTAAAYLRPARSRSNLIVLTRAHATRILIVDGKAVGVEFRTRDGLSTAYANGEIIVSAGVFGSPQLLLLSGVGPGQHLQNMGIPVVYHLRGVGSNLQEHFHLSCAWRIKRPLSMNVLHRSIPHQFMAGLKYMLRRSGPLASSGFYAGAFVRSDPRLERPDLQLHLIAWSGMRRSSKGIIPHPFPTFGISPVHLRPEGRGTVRLKGRDPLVQPEIRFNFLCSEYDVRAVLAGIRLARKIASQDALRDLVAEEVLPGETLER
ncbi:GMC family oxidoreductase N-terminal domain-containing protein [Bradyrhizobium sp. 137]|nr:GMC family oxidoreductase N-terminal domain-containing protein [Bradyrhizobium sp. 137]